MKRLKTYDLSYVEILTGKENMEKDWENLLSVEKGEKPIFRLYRWAEVTLSVGYSQNVPYFPVPVVKRPTGGGALLHGWDLSFSYAGLRKDWGGSFTKIYKNFMGLILEGLREISSEFDLSRYRGGYEDFFCYFYPTFGEITFKNRKILACAMRLMKDAFLIHGSLFLDFDYEFFEKLTGIEANLLRERVITFRELHAPEQLLFHIVEEKVRKLLLL